MSKMNKGDSALIMNSYMEQLKQSSLFKGFEENEIENFLNGVEHRFVELKANDKYELKFNKYTIVLSGFLIFSVTNKKGIIDTIQGLRPNYNAFLSSYISNTNNRLGTTVFMPSISAKYDTLLLELDAKDILANSNEHIMLNYRFHQNAVQSLCDTMYQRDIRAWCAISSSARETVMRYLLYLYRMQQSEHLVTSITREETASLLLIDTRTLLRELKSIKSDGIIDYKGKKITILKPEELIKYSETENSKGGNQNE